MTEVERLCMEKKCITCFHWEPSEHRPLGICHRANSVTEEGYFCGMWFEKGSPGFGVQSKENCASCQHWHLWEGSEVGVGTCMKLNFTSVWSFHCCRYERREPDAPWNGLGSVRGMRVRDSGEGGGRSL